MPAKKNTPTVKFIIKKWLKKRLDEGSNYVYSHEIEKLLPEYGRIFWGRIHNPTTYSRAWRELKSGNGMEDIDVISVTPDNTAKGAETKWILKTGT